MRGKRYARLPPASENIHAVAFDGLAFKRAAKFLRKWSEIFE